MSTLAKAKHAQRLPSNSIPKAKQHSEKKLNTGVTILKKLLEKNDDDLKKEISLRAANFYDGQEAKLLQVNAVANLSQGRNTFLLAGTGFGKSRIPEIYYKLLPQNSKPVVLVLNPLDALGNNQVAEKEGKFSAINLTKLTFNPSVARDIQKGEYNFVYLSPEIFMNNKLWDSIYFSSEFQERLALVVVDEAHMIYLWGLVEKNGRRVNAGFVRLEDLGIFRPCYGKLAVHLQNRNHAPILLLSATCRPVAIEAILNSLKLTNDLVQVMQGKLTRTEIRIIRIKMAHSLHSNLDLLDVFPSKYITPDDNLVPTLIYSGTRARTLTVLEVLDMARGTVGRCLDPTNNFARRFHSCTGEKDKEDCISGFSQGDFPIISSTMALGLGQNWKRVRCVIHMGRADPANIGQMIGRAGRDGKDGLAILFVEGNRKNGMNSPEDFSLGRVQSDDDRMDALAVTPVCLRVAFAIDNKLGYVPLSKEDNNYIAKVNQERSQNFPPCKCSNCEVESSRILIQNLRNITKYNFDSAMKDQFEFPNVTHVNPTKQKSTRSAGKSSMRSEADKEMLCQLEDVLISSFKDYYESIMGKSSRFSASDLFDHEEATFVVDNLDDIHCQVDISKLIGGEVIDGQLEVLMGCIAHFREGRLYKEHIINQERLKEEAEEEKRRKRREYAARYRANKRMKLLEQSQEINRFNQSNMPTDSTTQELVSGNEDDAARKRNEEAVEARKKKNREYAARYRAKRRLRLQTQTTQTTASATGQTENCAHSSMQASS